MWLASLFSYIKRADFIDPGQEWVDALLVPVATTDFILKSVSNDWCTGCHRRALPFVWLAAITNDCSHGYEFQLGVGNHKRTAFTQGENMIQVQDSMFVMKTGDK